MTGIVDAGGGMRGIFSAGIYDRFIEEGINFDVCIGVSAGSANLISYVAGHHDRLRRFYINYARRKQYMSFDNLIHSGSYIGLDYIYSTLSNADGEDPLNYDAYTESPTDFITVVTDGESGNGCFAYTRRARKANDLTVHLSGKFRNCKILKNTLLDFFKPVMVLVKYPACILNIKIILAHLGIRHVQQTIDESSQGRCFVRTGRKGCEPVDFFFKSDTNFIGKRAFLQSCTKLIGFRFFVLTQFFSNCLYLFAEEVFLLILFYLSQLVLAVHLLILM